MTAGARRREGQNRFAQDGGAALRTVQARYPSDEPTLDQLLAEPIVQQLMQRDQTDEATIRHLLQLATASLPASPIEDDPNAIARRLQESARLLCLRYDRELRTRLPGLKLRKMHRPPSSRATPRGQPTYPRSETLGIRPPTLGRLLDRLGGGRLRRAQA